MVSKVIRTLVVTCALSLMMFAAAAVPASANGRSGGFRCTALVGAVCIGQINGNTVEVDIGNVTILSGNQVTVLQDFLDNDAVNVSNLDVQTQVDTIAVDVADVASNLGISTCQIKVIEIGVVNTNIARCGGY